MSALNPAIGALPGWRGTDRKGGTWVRREVGALGRWAHFTASGVLVWRSQEEAEAAGLMRLLEVSEADVRALEAARTGPAPLDPGNPEHLPEFDEKNSAHLRWLADAVGDVTLPWASDEENRPEREQANNEMAETVEQFADFWRKEADRLDREHAEAEQDASDRAEADNYAKESSTTEEFWARHNAYLDGIRAERARQEAEPCGRGVCAYGAGHDGECGA